MKKIDFDILLQVYESGQLNAKEIKKNIFKNENKTNDSIDFLIKEGYLENNKITEKGKEKLEEYKVDNAIILAAGISSRFVPLNYEKPKGLLEVKGECLIERQIRAIRQKGIQEIVVVVGYMKEQFQYLVDKYGVILVESFEYEVRNNHSSVYAAKRYLKNSIVTSSDLYFTKNIFQKYAYDSYYTSIYFSGKTAERGIETDDDDKIIDTFYGDRCYDIWTTLGYAFFSERFSKKIIEILEREYNKAETVNKFWADIQDSHLDQLYMYAKRCEDEIIYEFDSLEELREFDNSYLNNSNSEVMKEISLALGAQENKIIHLESMNKIKKSMFKFKCNEENYMCDVKPNEEESISYLGDVYYKCQNLKTKNINLFKMKNGGK